jgi:TRAP-type mannitol/chloroaromatic compound transport system substrate-binding protein
MKRFLSLAATLAGMLAAAPALPADTISATHVFPASLVYSRSFLEYVKKANAAGKGVFTIQVRGGPEAIPMMQQPGAVRDGVVDMVYTACAFYAATVPECDAMSAATIDGPTARKNGGTELFNQIHQKRMGVYMLGWVDSGIRFNLWSTKEPKLDASGHIDIKGFKVRGHPIYNAFLTNYLGAQVINVNSPDLYTALERGTCSAAPRIAGHRDRLSAAGVRRECGPRTCSNRRRSVRERRFPRHPTARAGASRASGHPSG